MISKIRGKKNCRTLWFQWLVLIMGSFFIVAGCSGGGGGSDGSGGEDSDGILVLEGNDFLKLSIDGGIENTYTESFSSTIVCDPRVDWHSNQVILYDNYLGEDDWDILFDIMFISDEVGSYDVSIPADGINAAFIDAGWIYQANFATDGSSGTVTVTRSDTRIEGTFSINAVDVDSNLVTLSGSFSVDSGASLSCQ